MTMGIEKFRRMASQMRAGKGRSARYPVDARAWAVQFAERELGRGKSVTAVASELGVSDMTLRGWLYDASRRAGGELCQVVVTESEPASRPASRALTLTMTQGHVVTGLNLEDVAALLRVLG